MLRGVMAALAAIIGTALMVVLGIARGWFGDPLPRGQITPKSLPAAVIAARSLAHKQILFGDLHVHTAFSADAFGLGLPILNGEGVHPPADACDFARFCSALDFWAITDHAEQLTARSWQESQEMIRECEAVSGDPTNPDVVPFLGWEWTQTGPTPDTHYGHKSVILRSAEAEQVPARPINAGGLGRRNLGERAPARARLAQTLLDWSQRKLYFDLAAFQERVAAQELCPEGIDVRALPSDCLEVAPTPAVLFEKLRQWGVDALVIPHGTSWGMYTPPGSSWDKQLASAMHDPDRQRLIEVFSGRGNAEQYRDWRHVAFDATRAPTCPEPSDRFTPCCWRAGEIVRARCGDVAADVCDARVRAARRNFVQAGINGMSTVPGTTVADWLDCGTDRSLFVPAMDHRPAGSVQYALALSERNGDASSPPRRFRFGFVASSDSHRARPGTGFKELDRRFSTDSFGPRDRDWYTRLYPRPRPSTESVPFDPQRAPGFFARLEAERQTSFFVTGGLTAVHARGRDRAAIWDALERRETYATSGARILLWFDLLNAPGGVVPMGSAVGLSAAPRFRVRAAGALRQKPGCPEHTARALGPGALADLCRSECYNPGDERHAIHRLEIVRIRPREDPEEPIGTLIDDPWLVHRCRPAASSCATEFTDPDFATAGREAIYYVRAIQEATPMINASNVRCTYDDAGRCVEARPCLGSYLTRSDQDCAAYGEERAWSSPIFVRPQ